VDCGSYYRMVNEAQQNRSSNQYGILLLYLAVKHLVYVHFWWGIFQRFRNGLYWDSIKNRNDVKSNSNNIHVFLNLGCV